MRAPTRGWIAAVLDRKVVLALMLVYLIVSSINELAPVASRAIRWASAWHKPALSAVTLACLAWTWRGQAQRLWASACALIHRHVLRPHPATDSRQKPTLLNNCSKTSKLKSQANCNSMLNLTGNTMAQNATYS